MAVSRSPGPPRLASRPPARGERAFPNSQRGFTLMELILVVAVIGILSVVSIPLFVSFMRAQQARGAAEQVRTLLNQGRQLAITKNTSYHVEVFKNSDTPPNALRFCSGTAACPDPDPSGLIWKGPGSDSNGYLKLTADARIACASNTNFTSLGGATPTTTIQVQNLTGSNTLYVKISSAGRIRIDSTGGDACP